MPDSQPVQPLYFTVEDVAKQLQMSRSKVYELIAYKGLPVTHFGRLARIKPERLQEWLAQYEAEQSA